MSEQLVSLFTLISHIDCQIIEARRGFDALNESNINHAREAIRLIVERLPTKYGVRSKYDRIEWSFAEPVKHLGEVIEWLKRPNIAQRLAPGWLDDAMPSKLHAANLTRLVTEERVGRMIPPTKPAPPAPKKATQLAPGLYRLVVIDSAGPDDDVESILRESMVFDDEE